MHNAKKLTELGVISGDRVRAEGVVTPFIYFQDMDEVTHFLNSKIGKPFHAVWRIRDYSIDANKYVEFKYESKGKLKEYKLEDGQVIFLIDSAGDLDRLGIFNEDMLSMKSDVNDVFRYKYYEPTDPIPPGKFKQPSLEIVLGIGRNLF